jgi:Tfp pilus assembly protein PilV
MRGTSLIEVAIATALIAVMALGVAPLLAIAVRANAASRLEVDAVAAATERLEQRIAPPST